MIVLALALLGALAGVALARRREGNRLDIAQYAASFALIGATAGAVLTIIAYRVLV